MHYDFDIEVPANTTEASKNEDILTINYGVIVRVWVYFRGGCADLAHLQLWRGSTQVFPSNPGQSYAFDNYVVEFDEFYPILEPPFELKAITWNDDDTFPHTLTVMISVLPPSVVGSPEGRPSTEEELKEILGEYELAGGE